MGSKFSYQFLIDNNPKLYFDVCCNSMACLAGPKVGKRLIQKMQVSTIGGWVPPGDTQTHMGLQWAALTQQMGRAHCTPNGSSAYQKVYFTPLVRHYFAIEGCYRRMLSKDAPIIMSRPIIMIGWLLSSVDWNEGCRF